MLSGTEVLHDAPAGGDAAAGAAAAAELMLYFGVVNLLLQLKPGNPKPKLVARNVSAATLSNDADGRLGGPMMRRLLPLLQPSCTHPDKGATWLVAA